VLEEIVIDIVQDRAMSEIGPYIVVGMVAFVMFLGYHVTNRLEKTFNRKGS